MNEHGPQYCPKCGAPKAGMSCPGCGLVYEKFNPEREHANVPEAMRVLWENLERHWDDRAAHALFVEQGIRQDAAGFVAACYRKHDKDSIARDQLEKLTLRLMQSLDFTTSREPVTSKSFKRAAYLLLFVIIAILVFLIFAHAMK